MFWILNDRWEDEFLLGLRWYHVEIKGEKRITREG